MNTLAGPSQATNESPIRKKSDDKVKVKVTARACDACRRRKTRCSNNTDVSQPCAYCLSVNKACTYAPVVEKSAEPAHSRHHELQERIRAAEKRLRQLGSKRGIDLIAVLEERVKEEEQQQVEFLPNFNNNSQLDSSQSPPEADEEEANGVDKLRFIGPSSQPYFFLTLMRDKLVPPHEMDFSYALVEELLEQDHLKMMPKIELPSHELVHELIEAYFTHFNAKLFPLLHRPSFERALRAGMLETNQSFRGLVYIILALGCRWVKHPQLDKYNQLNTTASTMTSSSSNATNQSQVAAGIAFFRAFSGPSSPASVTVPSTLFDLQASVLCIIWLMGSTTGTTYWSAVGYAIRKAIDVGAHREHRERWTSSALEDQLRKRAFHLLYAFDRSSSIGIGRPVAIRDEDFDVMYPLDVSDSDLDTWNLLGSHTPAPQPPQFPTAIKSIELGAKIARILGHIHDAIYRVCPDPLRAVTRRVVASLNSELSDWLESVPPQLNFNSSELDPNLLAVSAALFSQYHIAQIMLHREFLHGDTLPLDPASSETIETHFNSREICVTAARALANLVERVQFANEIESCFWWIPVSCASAGVILLISLSLQTEANSSETELNLVELKKCVRASQALAKSTYLGSEISVGIPRLAQAVCAHIRKTRNTPQLQPGAVVPESYPPLVLPQQDLQNLTAFTNSVGMETQPTIIPFQSAFNSIDFNIPAANTDTTFDPFASLSTNLPATPFGGYESLNSFATGYTPFLTGNTSGEYPFGNPLPENSTPVWMNWDSNFAQF